MNRHASFAEEEREQHKGALDDNYAMINDVAMM